MSNIECAIKIMKDHGHVKCYAYGYDSMPMTCRIETESEKIGEKLLKGFKNNNDYIFCGTTIPCRSIEFISKESFKEWLSKFKNDETTYISWKPSHLDFEIKSFAEECGYKLEKLSHMDRMQVINLKIKAEIEAKKEAEEQEAIDLLDKIL